MADLFRMMAMVKTSNITASQGQKRDGMQLHSKLADATGPTRRRMDLRITHECYGSSSNPARNGAVQIPTVRLGGIGTGISQASKRGPIFSFATQGGKQASSYFVRGTGSKPARLGSGSLQPDLSLIL